MSVLPRRLTGHVLLWALICGLLVPPFADTHAPGTADPDCGPLAGIARGVAPGAVIRTATVAEHCVLCHWMRTISTANPGHLFGAAPGPVVDGPIVLLGDEVRRNGVRGQQSSRAPPAQLPVA